MEAVGPDNTSPESSLSKQTGSSWPRDWTQVSYVSCIGSRFFTTEPPGNPKRVAISSCYLNLEVGMEEMIKYQPSQRGFME